MNSKFFLLILISFFFLCKGDLYNLMDLETKRCYLENVPTDTLIVATYHTDKKPENNEDQSNFLINIEVSQEDGARVIATKDSPLNGKYALTVPEGGEYKICFSIKSKGSRSWFSAKPEWVKKKLFFHHTKKIYIWNK